MIPITNHPNTDRLHTGKLVLTKNYINSFDIEIRNHKGHLYPRSAIADFVLVLMFETVEEMEYNKDDLVAYNAMAYRVGHPTSSGILG